MFRLKCHRCLDQVHRRARLGGVRYVLTGACATTRACILLLKVQLYAHIGLSSQLAVLI